MKSLRKTRYVQKALKLFHDELGKLGQAKIPLNISLLTYIWVYMGVRILKPPLRDYYPLITDELITLYPQVSIFEQKFSFNN